MRSRSKRDREAEASRGSRDREPFRLVRRSWRRVKTNADGSTTVTDNA